VDALITPEDPVMLRRIALVACVLLGMVVCGCSTWSDYQAGQAGQFQSQNLWPTDKETRAGER
jgi:hypothetical protein